jgi:outer membrane protein OmpA-like peptidoglycan-associated protein
MSNFKGIPFLAISFALLVSSVSAADKKGSKDHPMISRYQGAEIHHYSEKIFDEYAVFTSQVKNYGGKEKNAEFTQTLEGKITEISYQAPPERSTLEVYRNYSDSLSKNGFQDIFQCKNTTCGGRNFNHAVASYSFFGEDYEDQRFLAAKLIREQGDVYVSLYVAMHNDGSQQNNNRVRVQLDIIELKPMETNMVVVDAEAMAKGLNAEGHIAIYAVYFDTNSAELKPASKPALAQVEKLMEQQPQLKLLIVGHTDNVGGLEHNKDLSRRRAASVTEALSTQHGINPSRLSSDGVAYLAPVASNRNEAGRTKNRRVELVENN